MKVLNPRVAMLSNTEVLAHLTATKQRYTASHAPMKCENLETVLKEVKEYLLQTPAQSQTEEQVKQLFEELAPYKLEKAELLMVLNEAPRGVAELDCVVEEMESRFGEEEVAGMLEIIKRVLAK